MLEKKSETLVTELFRRKMKENNFTQDALAIAIGAGLNQSKVSKILAGKMKPTLIQALRIEVLLGISVKCWGTAANDNEPLSSNEEA